MLAAERDAEREQPGDDVTLRTEAQPGANAMREDTGHEPVAPAAPETARPAPGATVVTQHERPAIVLSNAGARAEIRAEVRAEVGAEATVAAPASPNAAALSNASSTAPRGADAFRRFVWRPAPPGQPARADGRAELLARVLRADTSASLRRLAAWGLAEYADAPAAAAALAAALRTDANAPVRETAAWSLAESNRDAGARDALAAALRADADARVRATAAWALGSLGDRGATDALAAALADPSPEVRTRAVWALGSVEPREAPRALVAMLGDREPKVRELTAWALFTIEDPAAAPALQNALRAERDVDLQVAYVRALGALGEKSVDALRGLLDSPDPRIRTVAVRALAGGHAAGPWPWPWPQPRPSP